MNAPGDRRAQEALRLRFGYRRLLVLMRREGLVMNHKKFRRLYREERLQVRRRGGRKRALGTRAPLAIPQGTDQRWSLDFLSDALLHRARWAHMQPGFFPSLDEARGSDQMDDFAQE